VIRCPDGSSLGRGWRRGNKCAWTAISAPQETMGGKGWE
jgi:hypothetical protein